RRDGGFNGNKARDNSRRPAYQDDLKALVTIDGEAIKWSGHVEEDTQNFAMMAYSSSNSGSDNEGITCLLFTYGPKQTLADESDSKPVECASSNSDSSVETTTSMFAPVDNSPKIVCEPKVWTDAPIIEEYESDSDVDLVSNVQENIEKPSFAFINFVKHVKSPRENVAMISMRIKNFHKRTGNYMPSGPDVEIDYSQFTYGPKQTSADESDSKPVEYASSDFDSSVEPSTSVPEPVVSESKVVNEPKTVCEPKRMAKQAALTKSKEKGTGQQAHRPVWNNVQRINHQNKFVPSAVLTKIGKIPVNAARQNFSRQAALTSTASKVTARPFDDPHKALKDKGIIYSGCSKHMTGNKAHLADYQEFKGGSVAFGGSNGRINGKGKIKAGRLGHVNFKNLNKLVKGNLVKGLPSKIFENDHTCVACQKGKQHKASCKAKIASCVNQPLQILYMDLFGPTSDETTPILKDFIRQAENQFNHKVKTIQSDNGTEFKNHNLIEFCGSKRIKREYSNARTPQQNGVAERNNMTLIEVARAMLADSFLPTTFWAKAVNTACYVLNRVLVTKPQNKTPYELLTGPKEANHSAGTEANDDQDTNSEETDLHDEYFVLHEELEKLKRQEKEDNNAARKEATHETQDVNTNSTNLLNVVSIPVSVVGPSRALNDAEPSYPDDPLMPHLEDIYASLNTGIFNNSFYDDEGVVTDFNNFKIAMNFSPTPTTRIHTIHPKTQILEDPLSAVQTRSKVYKNSETHALVSYIQKQQRNNHKDFQNYLFAYFLSQVKPKKISQALEDESWVDAMNKKDERGVVVRNKARLVSQGHRQEEGIDYEVVFAPVARIEAIRIFLAFASYMGFIVYQMDVKSAFLYGTIDEEVYVIQPLGFVDPKFPNKVYKVVKALYGLHQAPRAWSIIGSLMYLTAFRPNIMFAVCACSRFQVTPKTSHLQAVKRIFRYLKGQPKLGIWYPKVSSFNLEACSDSDYVGANLDRKSITGEAEYVVVAHCCGQVLWIQNQLLDYGFNLMNTKIYIDNESTICIVKNLVFHSKTKHIKIRHHFIRDAYEKKLIQGRLLKVTTAKQRLLLPSIDDEEGTSCLANDDIFTGLANMGYEKMYDKLTFYKEFFSLQWKFLIHTILQCLSAKTTFCNEFSNTMASTITCLATKQKFNFSSMLVQAAEEVGEAQDDVSIPTKPSTSKPPKKHKSKKHQPKAPKVPSPTPSPEHQLPSPTNDPILDVLDLESKVIDLKSSFTHKIAKLEDRVHKLEEENRILKETSFKSAKVDTATPPTEVEEVLEVVKAAKLMTEVVTTAQPTNTAAQVPKPSAPRKRRGVVIQDSEEKTTSIDMDEAFARQLEAELNANINWNDVIEQVKRSEKQDNIMIRYQALKRKPVTEAQARKNMMIYLKNMVGFKMDFFKGESLEQETTKIQRMYKEAGELKRHLQIVANDDDVYTEATPLALKVPIIDYQIHHENNKPYYKIIRADRTYKLFLSFITLLKNFDKEDLEALWKFVKETFETTKPKNFSDDFLLNILKIMFEKPNVEASVWKDQKGRYRLAKVKSWKLFESCRVHVITLTTTQMILLVEKKYPLTHFTLQQMLDNVRL
nr:ribonuclease H-like domain-containing protein [Tanacetum cinerariifolium]